VGELAHFDCVLPDRFVVCGIIAKLSILEVFLHELEAQKTMTIESLITSLDVEEKAKSKDVHCSIPQESLSNANVVEGKSHYYKNSL
jgi:hypothetical protein